MPRRGSLQGIASAAALGFGLSLGVACAGAAAGAEYPDWQAQWRNASGGHFNSAKPRMRQEAPLTAEYQAIYDAGVANAAAGGQGNDPMWRCIPPGMPRAKRAPLAWTEALTLVTQGHVPYEVYEAARGQFDERELADLTPAIVAINGANRLNIAFRTVPGAYRVAAARAAE
jgi:alkylhydroperoxidase family enzyme